MAATSAGPARQPGNRSREDKERKEHKEETDNHELRPRRDDGSGETRKYRCAPDGEKRVQGHWDAQAFQSHHAAADKPANQTAETTMKPAETITRSLTDRTAIRQRST